MRKWIVWYVILLLILSCILPVEAIARKRKKVQAEEKKLSEYEKLFQGKQVETARGGFVTLHKVNGKVYVEYPLKYMGREMLLASTATSSTNGLLCTNGYKENIPMHLRITLGEKAVLIRKVNALMDIDAGKEKMREVKEQNFGDPVLMKYDVLAYSRDSSAVVFDMTDLFLDKEKSLGVLPKNSSWYGVAASEMSELSSIREVKAFEDNVSVKSQLAYRYSLMNQNNHPVLKDKPLTVVATRTLLLLPENKMKPRVADVRLGTFLTYKRRFTENGKTERYTCANRWDLQPKDVEAFRRGELVEPVKPIVFYVDTLFPASWREPIRVGVTRWNRAFEKIGFKNVMQVRDFPIDDPDFDPDNLKYSCIRYVPRAMENAMGPSWVDPETGEILNAGIFVYNNVVDMLRDWRFIQTAQVDESARGKQLPVSLFNESLAYVIAHEVGHCLGLMHNMSASHAYPVDSLRSASFTQRYGTTPSIMDYARFNYVAQPGDKGVKLTPPDLGVYDEFAIRWLYTPIYGVSEEEEARVLERWVDEKAGDPLYRYGRQQVLSRYDPSALEEDLGDDAMKAGDYGILNLKYILPNVCVWIQDDEDFECRYKLYQQILRQYYRYVRNVLYNVGGVYLSDAKEESGIKRFTPVPKELQQVSMRWVMKQLHDMTWLNEKSLLKKVPLSTLPSMDIAKALGDLVVNAYGRVALASSLGDDDSYSLESYFDDLYRGVWDGVINDRKLTREDQILHRVFLNQVEKNVYALGGNRLWLSGYSPSAYDRSVYGLENANENNHEQNFGYGYGWQRLIDTKIVNEAPAYYLNNLKRVQELLETKMNGFSPEERDYYEMVLFAVKQMLGKRGGTK